MRVFVWVATMLLAAGAAACPASPDVVERWFSTGIFPPLQQALTTASNGVPFALLDLLILGTLIWVIVRIARGVAQARAERRAAPLLVVGAVLAQAAAIVYLVFLGLWGLNYRRVPMAERLAVDSALPQAADVMALARRSVGELNATYEAAHASSPSVEPWRDEHMLRAFADVQRLLTDTSPAVPGRLKASLLGRYFRWTGVDGMVDPFALEVLVNPDLLAVERPFVAAHEWAHLAGYADESEASFVGWLTCLRAGAAGRYSGWLSLYWQLAGEISPTERAEIATALDAGPRSDIAAIAERLRRGQLPALRRVGWGVYDQYLKANRVEAGVRSYSQVVSLILRVRFEEGWVPIRRDRLPHAEADR